MAKELSRNFLEKTHKWPRVHERTLLSVKIREAQAKLTMALCPIITRLALQNGK
jgi:hypothetical protein